MITLLATALLLQAPPSDIDKARDALPEHQLRKCGSAQFMCFELEPFKLLLLQSNERLTLLEERTLLVQKLLFMSQQITALEATLKVKDEQLTTWKTDHARLLEKWKEENRLRHKAEIKANSPWPIVTMVVGGLLGASGAIWGAFNHEEPAPWIMTGSGLVVLGVGTVDLFF